MQEMKVQVWARNKDEGTLCVMLEEVPLSVLDDLANDKKSRAARTLKSKINQLLKKERK